MEERQLYNYYAFISYSSADGSWAKWLQKKLEGYRLPAAVRKESIDIPKRLSPVFRDETDLSTGVLENVLRQELEASKYLIVLCSPNSAKSQWVDNEVREFIQMGRAERIVPLVISGEPFAKDPTREAFPPALREMEQELIGISVEKFGRKEAFLRVAAALLGIRYDKLAMREKRRSRSRRIAAAAAALAAAVGIGVGVWYNTPHSKYYSAYVYENEVPQGLYELTQQEREGLSYSYKITTLRGKVTELQCVNSKDTVTEPVMTFPTSEDPYIRYFYDDNGRLISMANYDTTGNQVSGLSLTYNESERRIAVDYRTDSDSFDSAGSAANLLYGSAQAGDANSEITRQINTYDENGRLIKAEFMRDNLGTRASDSNGVYGKFYEYDDLGQVVRIHNLDSSGEIYNCKYGWATIALTYDDHGRILSEKTYDADGNPARNQTAAAETRYTYDETGNLTFKAFYDAQGNLCNNREGIAQIAMSYDDNGFCEIMYFGNADNMMAYDEDGICGLGWIYDEQGRQTGIMRLDENLEPYSSEQVGYAMEYYTLDELGRVVTIMLFDENYQLTPDPKLGFYIVDYVYDANGRIAECLYYDGSRNLMNTTDGYARTMGEFDDNGNMTRIAFLGADGELAESVGLHAAIVEMDHDAFGNVTVQRFYDENGALKEIWEQTFVDGNTGSVKFFDGQHQPIIGEDGFVEGRFSYDAKGNRTKMAYYDADGSLMKMSDGRSVIEYEFDAYGNETAAVAYDENYRFQARLAYVYDARSNIIRGEVTYGDGRVGTVKLYAYSENDTLIAVSRYTAEGELLDYEGELLPFY